MGVRDMMMLCCRLEEARRTLVRGLPCFMRVQGRLHANGVPRLPMQSTDSDGCMALNKKH